MPRVVGNFSTQAHRPFVRALVSLPRLSVSGWVHLLVDTGADATALHWGDRMALASMAGPMPTNQTFQETTISSGISGDSVDYGVEEAQIGFRDDEGGLSMLHGQIEISLVPQPSGIPSLLGRDFLSQMVLTLDMSHDLVTLEWPDAEE
jgi:hypothetical protein